MLVVIGMITIVMAVAISNLRKLFEDFRINQTVQEVDTLISSYRSYYLIMNEFPTDTNGDTLRDTKADWCLPRNFYTASPHKFSIKPYKATKFDFDVWTDNPGRDIQDCILINIYTLSDTAITEKYKIKLSKLYPKNLLPPRPNGYLGVVFPELTKDYTDSEPVSHRNRYH